jgi:hypothetical protein
MTTFPSPTPDDEDDDDRELTQAEISEMNLMYTAGVVIASQLILPRLSELAEFIEKLDEFIKTSGLF